MRPRLQILGDLLELPDVRTLFVCHWASRRFQAVVDVVVNQGALGIRDGFSTAWSC